MLVTYARLTVSLNRKSPWWVTLYKRPLLYKDQFIKLSLKYKQTRDVALVQLTLKCKKW